MSWFAGLFYLPRLFVYHTRVYELHCYQMFSLMEKRLYRFIMYPAMIIVLATGLGMIALYGWNWFQHSHWLHAKILAVFILVGYHHWLGSIIKNFENHTQPHSENFFRFINEIPTVFLIVIICLVKIRRVF